MAITERHGMTGHLTIVLRDCHGQVVLQQRVNNLITTAGKTLVAELFTGALQGKPEFSIAVGNGAKIAVPGDTQLERQLDRAPAITPAIRLVETEGQQKAVATITATLPMLAVEAPNQELSEAGILIELPNQKPVLYNRVTFPVITRTNNLEMTLTWEVLF